MTEDIVQLTIQLKDMDAIDVACNKGNPILQQLCFGLASRGRNPDEVMYLQLSDDKDEYFYFPKSALQAIHSDQKLPGELFLDPNAMKVEDYEHLDIDRSWIDWAIENLEKGYPKEGISRIMLDNGMTMENVSELLDFDADKPVGITKRDDLQSILPLKGTIIPGKKRIMNDYVELYQFEDFLSRKQCDEFKSLLVDDGARSTVVADNPIHEVRTSSSFTFNYGDEIPPLVTETQARLCGLVGVDLENAEALQCQIYKTDQRYKAHHDFFNAVASPPYVSYDGKTRNGQRQWSALVYLRDSESSCGTLFPMIREEFTPTRGTALLWNNLYPDGKPNYYTLHCGLPAGKEKKLVLTQWIRNSEPV